MSIIRVAIIIATKYLYKILKNPLNKKFSAFNSFPDQEMIIEGN